MRTNWLKGIIFCLVSICIFLIYHFNRHNPRDIAQDTVVSTIEKDSIALPEQPPKVLYGMVIDSLLVIEDKIKRDQNLAEILSPYNVSHQVIHKLAKISHGIFDVRKIRANQKYILLCRQDSLKTAEALVYEPNSIEYVVFNLRDSVFVEKRAREVKTVERELAGEIEYSLAVTMDELGVTPQLTNDFVDVFAWQIDFFRLQKGDRFKVIYEEKLVDGQPVGIGDIKAVYFNHFGNDYYGIRHDQGNGPDYFDEEGKSLRKALLKYPLKFTRISSRYSGRRFHPVQKRWKAHRGTDFAAPRGTPIRSVGDGIVVEAKYGKYNGNYVKVRHNSTYSTQYLHMSKIAKGMKPGVKVKQGQTIGYVGSTGLATGAHLCYRFWKNGVQVDALKVDLPSAEPIDPEKLPAYNLVKRAYIERLNAIEFKDHDEMVLARGK